jgi:hypothetical protein
MKRLIILAGILLVSALAVGQNVRYRAEWPSVSANFPPYLVANLPPNSPTIAVCHSPANAVPCTNYATTYTGSGTACPNGAQDTPDPNALTSACQPTGDAQGNIGFWAPAGTYDYTVCIQNNCFGPYTVTLGGTGGGGGGTPNPTVSFVSSLSATISTGLNTNNIVWECWDSSSPANTIYPSNVSVDPVTYVVTFTFLQLQSGYCVVNANSTLGVSLAANNAFTGANTFPSINAIQYIDGTHNTTLAAYLAAPSANTTLIVPSNQTISSYTTYSVANLWIKCENGATITFGTSGALVPTGAGDGFEGCTFIGGGVGVARAGAPIQMSGGGTSNFQPGFFRHNSVTNFGTTAGNGEVEILGGSHWDLSGNTISNNADFDIFVNNATASASMNDILLAGNEAGEIIVHTTGASSNISHLRIANNDLHNGQNSKVEFCEEVGAFGGSVPTDVQSIGNQCYATANGTDGGYSWAGGGVQNCVETGDLFDAEGFTFTVAAIERTLVSNCATSVNTLILGTGGIGITCDRCSNSTFIGNVVNGFAPSTSGIHVLVSNTTGPAANDNIVANNTIIYSVSSSGGIGIWIQCNAAGSTCNNNSVRSNHILGLASGTGITIENDTGTVTGNSVSQNQVTNLPNGLILGGAATNTFIADNDWLTITTPYSTSGSGMTVRGKQTLRPAGCATAGSVGGICASPTVATWTFPFSDANYTANCTGDLVSSGVPVLGGVTAKSGTSITVQTVATTAAAAQFTAIDCAATHD